MRLAEQSWEPMHSRLRCRSHIVIVALLRATSAIAQTSPPPTGSAAVAPTTESTRPATTFDGDTGLWYVPSANVLPHAQVSLSGYRRGTNYVPGYTNVADFASTV